ncbi:PAS domain S-box protein [Saccharibacillus kuerlensis]|uniref:PAS domain-containing protein n=1 Tax=Saccharibacillus kuerlensis TaxID=459527 RepID=A0ABQ2L3U9_9BACL|nr:PAS domain-containing protein [Saccharibacillus kuerlensis]GGO01527.1 hypothetical protein GCM10010969_23930 [Saccharibacillus kuerlensis]
MDNRLQEAPCGYLALSEDNRIIEVNQTLASLLGYEAETLKGMKIEYILAKSSRLLFQIYFTTLITLNGKLDEMFLSLYSLTEVETPVLLSAARRERAEGIHYECILFPLTRRIEYEKQLNKVESKVHNAYHRLQSVEQQLQQKEARLAELNDRLAAMEANVEHSNEDSV